MDSQTATKKVSPGRVVLYSFTGMAIASLLYLNISLYVALQNDEVLQVLVYGIVTFIVGIIAGVLSFYSILGILHAQIARNRRVAGFALLLTSMLLTAYWGLGFVFPFIMPSLSIVPWLALVLPLIAIFSFIHGFILYAKGTIKKTT